MNKASFVPKHGRTGGDVTDDAALGGMSRWFKLQSFGFLLAGGLAAGGSSASSASLEVGLATRDVTPTGPIWLAGYAARNKPSERVDTRLLAQACALRSGEDRVVLVALDNCEVSGDFTAPLLRELAAKHSLKPGAVMIVSSHTHSGPVLEGPLQGMYPLSEEGRATVKAYGEKLRTALAETVSAALQDLQPAELEHGMGQANFGMNRRAVRDKAVVIGENPEGPVDREVPVLKIKGTNGAIRGILLGYACHATTIAGDDFYVVSGDFPAYARQHLETCYPGTTAMFLTGMGADLNPSPRGQLLDSKRHGLQLAGAVAGVLGRPMRPVRGPLRLAYEELELPLETPPTAEQVERDAQSENVYIRNRAQGYLALRKAGQPLPTSVRLPLAVLRIGDDLTFVAMGGEVVVEYGLGLKRMLAGQHPWTIGYAYDVPCYIPTVRVLKEGGYEADSSLIYYGIYGPFKPAVEELVMSKVGALAGSLRAGGSASDD